MLQSDKYKSEPYIREGIEKICIWAWAGVELSDGRPGKAPGEATLEETPEDAELVRRRNLGREHFLTEGPSVRTLRWEYKRPGVKNSGLSEVALAKH